MAAKKRSKAREVGLAKRRDKDTIEQIRRVAREVNGRIGKLQKPELKSPLWGMKLSM